MSRKPKQVCYAIRDRLDLQLQFYEKYDPNYLYCRAQAIAFALMCKDEYREFLDRNFRWQEELSEDHLHALETELHFLEIHQGEALFAILFALFQPLAHWLYLTEYKNEELVEKIRLFAQGKISTLTENRLKTLHEFLDQAVYSGFRSSDPDKRQRWEGNLDNMGWVLKQLARRHLEGREDNNAYKHGLRVARGHQAALIIHPTDQPEKAQQLCQFDNYISFLETKKEGEVTGVYLTTKPIHPELSLNCIFIMRQILVNIKQTRLTRLKKSSGVQLFTLFEFDRDGFERAEVTGKFSITV